VRALRFALVALFAVSLIGAIAAAAIGVSRLGSPLATATFRFFFIAAIGALVTLCATRRLAEPARHA
jgi:uncharacterized membrane protein YeaQ/YmgE (transglycosylase-associated protein family)